MTIVARFAAFWLVVFTAFALGGASPARADPISEYRAQLDAVALDMRALWGEIERFHIQQRYCLPPYGPVKQPDTMMMQAYSARADALVERYRAIKLSLKDFLKDNSWAHSRLMVAGKDPNDDAWWKRWETSRDKMIEERNKKREALAKAPERDCTPRAKPAIAVQPPPPLVLPQRPRIPPFTWPDLPRHFCSELEKLNWKIANINPQYLREAEVALAVARYRSQVEGLVNDHVQANKPIPPALAEARRQAIADSRAWEQIEKANAAFYRRFAAVPIVDCKTPLKEDPPKAAVETGMAPAPSDPRHRALLDMHNGERRIFGSPPLKWDQALAASAQRYAEVMARTGRLEHSPREGRGTARENLSQGLPGWGPQQLMGNWLKERSRFKPGTYPDVSITGNWEDVSHYSQVVWPKTTDVGCGIADGQGFRWLVCHYNPGGNKDGTYISNAPQNAGMTLPRDKQGGGMQRIDPPIAQDKPPHGDIAPTGSPSGIAPVDSQGRPLQPPPPPPPNATNEAPDGDEARHPLVGYANNAHDAFITAWRNGDRAAQAAELAKMRYAFEELRKRLKAARKARNLSTVDPLKVAQEMEKLDRLIKDAQRRYDGVEERG